MEREPQKYTDKELLEAMIEGRDALMKDWVSGEMGSYESIHRLNEMIKSLQAKIEQEGQDG